MYPYDPQQPRYDWISQHQCLFISESGWYEDLLSPIAFIRKLLDDFEQMPPMKLIWQISQLNTTLCETNPNDPRQWQCLLYMEPMCCVCWAPRARKHSTQQSDNSMPMMLWFWNTGITYKWHKNRTFSQQKSRTRATNMELCQQEHWWSMLIYVINLGHK